jgi:hypothetical protein
MIRPTGIIIIDRQKKYPINAQKYPAQQRYSLYLMKKQGHNACIAPL